MGRVKISQGALFVKREGMVEIPPRAVQRTHPYPKIYWGEVETMFYSKRGRVLEWDHLICSVILTDEPKHVYDKNVVRISCS